MKVTLKLSRVGMNMQQAMITRWHKRPGDTFRAGEELYDIETEKVTQAIEASGDGKLLEILVPAGTEAQVGQAVCSVEMQLQSGG